MPADVETVVVGAGVVGLAVARALVTAGHETLVLERHGGIGLETSSRSSEVIHAGIYYPPDSLRARLCVEGREMLYAFARDNGVPHRRCGKLVVATGYDELTLLDALARNAEASGVTDLVRLTRGDVGALEPEVTCRAALFSPSTGVIDSHALMVALEGHVRANAGSVVLNTNVQRLAMTADGLFEITTAAKGGRDHAMLTARNLVLAGGLGATRLGEMLVAANGYRPPVVYPARGHYYILDGTAPFRHLVYPMPSDAWLGVHLTLDMTGRARFGPDLDWQHEGRGRPDGAGGGRPEDGSADGADYAFDDCDGARRARFETAIRRYWPGLPEGRLSPGYVGVRPKIYRKGEPAADFAIHGHREHGFDRLVALYGIESPGLTSSLAIGAHVASMLAR